MQSAKVNGFWGLLGSEASACEHTMMWRYVTVLCKIGMTSITGQPDGVLVTILWLARNMFLTEMKLHSKHLDLV